MAHKKVSCKSRPVRVKGHGTRYRNPCTGRFVSSRGKKRR